MSNTNTTPFYGRSEELHRLEQLLLKKTASLVVIKGRRRIGKSRLISEFSKKTNSLVKFIVTNILRLIIMPKHSVLSFK